MSEDRFLRRVQALLDLAGHPNTPEDERANALAKADAIMFERRIDDSMLRQSRTEKEKVGEIIQKDFDMGDHYEFLGEQKAMLSSVFGHFGCKIASNWKGVYVVGFERDIEMGEMMWLTIQRDFVTKLFPAWDKNLTVQENVYNIKSSGKSWMDIVHLAPEDAGLNKNSGGTLRSMYKREAAKRGVENVEHSRTPAKYRATFSESFASRIQQRLYQMGLESKQGLKDRDESKSVALIKDEDLVAEEFYKLFEHLRPKSDAERKAAAEAWAKQREEERLAEEERRAKLTDRQRQMEDEKREREDERNRRRWAREDARSRPDVLGWRNGKDAADSVQLTETKTFNKKEQIR